MTAATKNGARTIEQLQNALDAAHVALGAQGVTIQALQQRLFNLEMELVNQIASTLSSAIPLPDSDGGSDAS